jgi:low affinity Fe/Cu permease
MNRFRQFAHAVSAAVGSRWSFLAAVALVLAWVGGGLVFGFSDSWLLAMNTAATLVTFLMVFLIQNAQNRHYQAIHLKLNELIRGTEGPRTHLVDLKSLTDEELHNLEKEFQRLRQRETARANRSPSRPPAGGGT